MLIPAGRLGNASVLGELTRGPCYESPIECPLLNSFYVNGSVVWVAANAQQYNDDAVHEGESSVQERVNRRSDEGDHADDCRAPRAVIATSFAELIAFLRTNHHLP